jgi:hypothetical protein
MVKTMHTAGDWVEKTKPELFIGLNLVGITPVLRANAVSP